MAEKEASLSLAKIVNDNIAIEAALKQVEAATWVLDAAKAIRIALESADYPDMYNGLVRNIYCLGDNDIPLLGDQACSNIFAQ